MLQEGANGEVEAIIVPRTGLLATLLGYAGNSGEMASATDAVAQVKYNGTVNQAKTHWRSKFSGGGILSTTATTIPTATPTLLDINAASLILPYYGDYANITSNAAGDYFTMPAAVAQQGAANGYFEIGGLISLTGIAAPGTYVKVDLEYNVTGSTWVAIQTYVASAIANLVTVVVIPKTVMASAGNRNYRFLITHDSASSRTTISGSTIISVDVYAG